VVNSAIYLIASYDFFVNRSSCCVTNQQQLQHSRYITSLAAYVMTGVGKYRPVGQM